MTYEEAIERLKNAACDIGMEEAVDIAIEALEKQIPMKPYKVCEGLYHCESCGTVIRNAGKFCDEYCDHCGQKIDWSDNE